MHQRNVNQTRGLMAYYGPKIKEGSFVKERIPENVILIDSHNVINIIIIIIITRYLYSAAK